MVSAYANAAGRPSPIEEGTADRLVSQWTSGLTKILERVRICLVFPKGHLRIVAREIKWDEALTESISSLSRDFDCRMAVLLRCG